jgi:uncharacterized membrane protein
VAEERINRGPLISAGLMIGAGMGGFVDGILLHQILQWHNMVSAKHPPTTLVNAEVNMFWDGIFHAGTWIVTALGMAMLWSAGKRGDVPWSGRTFAGSLILGWGVFNLVEGIINHHLIGIHHVVTTGPNQAAWDYGFLGLGAVQAIIGMILIRAGKNDRTVRLAL